MRQLGRLMARAPHVRVDAGHEALQERGLGCRQLAWKTRTPPWSLRLGRELGTQALPLGPDRAQVLALVLDDARRVLEAGRRDRQGHTPGRGVRLFGLQ
jgi:hypothetical protein